jgi:type IX secretion system PorP/SprF family membrane protein
MRNFFIISTSLLLSCVYSYSQQSPIYSQYILNEFIINPSVAGIDGMTTFNFSARKQWVGWENAPSTYSACFSTRLLKTDNNILSRFTGQKKFKKGSSGRVGLGASLSSDYNGAISRIGMNMTYSYHIFVDNNQLSFGLSLLAQQFKIDNELAQFSRPDGSIVSIDPLEGLLGKSAYMPDAAFGINYSAKHFNAGVSIFQLFQSPVKFGDTEATFKELKQVRHYNFMGTYNNTIRSNPHWDYESSVIIRSTESLQASADLSLRLIYKREYWAGLSFRTSGDFILIMGVKLNRFYFGYSFDYGFNEISRLTYGSHEISLAIKIGDSTRRYRYWERY